MNATCCPACGSELRDTFRFCPGCARPLRRKLVEFFAGHPERPGDAERMLRLSRYLPNGGESSHARFSIWNEHQVVEAGALDR